MQYVSIPKIQDKKKNKEDLKIITMQQFNQIEKKFPFESNFIFQFKLHFILA